MTTLQRFLRSGGTFETLLALYSIKAKRHGEHPSLVLFKYDQIASPMGERICQESRGIILDESDGWRCVSRSFDKFFNYGEGHAASIDWSTARVQEKVDGSLLSLYWYGDRWHVATTGMADAAKGPELLGKSFAWLFWNTWGIRPMPNAAKGITFLFELTSPWTRIVVQHERDGLTLLGAREAETGRWLSMAEASSFVPDVAPVGEHPLQSFDEIAATFDNLSPLATEGYVVVDGNWNRVKVKHPGYVALHHAKDGLSLRSFVDIARSNETSEVIVAFPEFKEKLEDVRAKYEAFVSEVSADYDRLCAIGEQKAFALEATKTRCSSALFMTRAGKCESPRAYLQSVPADKMVQWLGLKDEPVASQEAA